MLVVRVQLQSLREIITRRLLVNRLLAQVRWIRRRVSKHRLLKNLVYFKLVLLALNLQEVSH